MEHRILIVWKEGICSLPGSFLVLPVSLLNLYCIWEKPLHLNDVFHCINRTEREKRRTKELFHLKPERSGLLGHWDTTSWIICVKTFLAHNNDLRYMNTCYAKKSYGLPTMQKDLYKLGYILKEIVIVFSHLHSSHPKTTDALCHVVG